ncbi:hypothetical protein AALP_AA1G163100 [Arabis alpina]|uniref:Cation/H+ exchanger transmembrane domain-containing protein n=1 Tax=Arabis alpina TaxID=50452 RepID=A0A087HNL0_ARAAL|nr:hypothetical protein AALP_AA1G163100 [Arabis alpina]
MDVHQIKRCMGQMILLAGPGVLISTFCIGSLLKVTVAVVALLKELGASKKLTTIIDGESVMNDGVSVVVFHLFFKMVMGHNSDWGSIIKFLAQNSFGAHCYFAYYTVWSSPHAQAQEWAGVSGILTVMTLGMFFAAFARTAFKGDSHQSLHHFWEMVAYIANTLVFILSGFIIAEGILSSQRISYKVLYPLLRRFGYGLNWKESIILTWSGLRGAVSLSLALSVKQSSGNSYLSSETGTRFLFFTGDDEELGSSDWHTVITHISSLKDLDGRQVNPYHGYEAGNVDPMSIVDIRMRLLNGVQAAYWEMFDDGRITQSSANILMQSVDEALDLVSTNSLCDWRGLKPCVHFANYYKFLQSQLIPSKLATYLIVNRLESACYISSAFLRAHRIARQQLHYFLGNSDIASTGISESEVEGEEPKQFLEDVRDSFPQVLSVLKTRQVTHYVLNHLNGNIKNLEKIGMLQGKEVSHLNDVVQSDLKKLLRNPPLLKLPNADELIITNPLWRSL